MSDNRVAQLIQQLDDAIMMGDDDLIEQIRSDLFREYGIERSGRAEMGLGGLIGKAIGNAVNTMIKQKRSPIGRARGSQSTQSKFYDDFDDVVREVDDPRLDKQQQDIIEQMIEMGEMDPFANGGRVDLQAGGMPKPKPTMGIMAANAARGVTGAAPFVKSGLGKAINYGLGTPALVYDVMAGQTGGAFDPIYGKYEDEVLSPSDFGFDNDDPIPELGGYSYDELVNDPEYIAYAKEAGLSPERYVTELIADYTFIPEKGPADPSAFTMDELEEYFGDTPFLQDYKENVPLGDRASRGFDKVVSGIYNVLNPLGAFERS